MRRAPMKSSTRIPAILACACLFAGHFPLVHAEEVPPPSLLQLAFPGTPSSEWAGRHPKDYSPFSLAYARTWGNPNGLEVVFTAPVDPATATNAANYTLAPGVSITGAALGTNASTVLLRTTTMTNGVAHTLSAGNILDATLQYPLSAPASVPVLKAQGVLTRQLFAALPGASLGDLTNAPKFPNAPDAVDFPSAFEATANLGDNYGLQLAGYVHPPVTGDYAFFIAADEQAALSLSPDDDPAHKTLIATVPSATPPRAYTSLTNQRSPYVRLEAGRAYFIEALLKEAGGSDHLAVTWRLRGMSVPAAGDAPIPGAFLSSQTPSAPVGIGVPPQPQTVAEGASATFAVAPTGTPPYRWQWFRDRLPIPGANAASYTLPVASGFDQGAEFFVVVSNDFSSATSVVAALTVLLDTNPPTLVRIVGSPTLDKVVVGFSKPLAASTANLAGHYALEGGLAILTAQLLADGQSVALSTTPQTPGRSYTLRVAGVTDNAFLHNAAEATTNFSAWVLTPGYLNFMAYDTGDPQCGRNQVSLLTGHPSYPYLPRESLYLSAADSRTVYPNDSHEGYGARLLGFFVPPQTGYWLFYCRNDDDGEIWLNPHGEDLGGLQQIIASPGAGSLFSARPSAPLPLIAGQKYAFQGLYKEGCGGDYLQVAAKLAADPTPPDDLSPIPGAWLATYADPLGAALAITQQPLSVTVLESSTASFTVAVSSSYSPVFYQWQQKGADIAGANGPTYTTPRLFRTDQGARFRCRVSIPGTNLFSAEAAVTVTLDNAPPELVSAATLTGSDTLGLAFSELLDPTTATNPAHYTLSTGGRVLRAALRPDGQIVALTVATLSFTNFTVLVNGVKDLAGNPVAANTRVEVVVSTLESTAVGLPGVNPLVLGATFVSDPTNLEMVAGGTWPNSALGGFHFAYEVREGDFDASVRLARLDPTSYSTLAALIARDNLSWGSPYLMAYAHPPGSANAIYAYHRAQQDAPDAAVPGAAVSYGVPIPDVWLRLQRSGDVFTTYFSHDGSNWTQSSQMPLALSNRVFLGLAACASVNALGQTTTARFQDYTVTGTVVNPTPLDLLLKKPTDPASSFSLEGVYQTTPHGAQNLWQTATSNAPAVFQVQVRQDGPEALSPVVKAIETAETGWTVTYRDGPSDVTALIRGAGGYALTNLSPGVPATLTVEFLPGSRVLGGTPKSATLSVFTDPYTTSLRDTVRATSILEPSHQPDLMVRRLTDVIYRGKGVFNADGMGQTKTLELDYGMTGVYPIQLLNAGNGTNTFTLRGTAGGAGWTVRYLDAVSAGADITADMTGEGTLVVLPVAASWEGRVEVTFDGTVPRGASNLLFVTATAVGGDVANPAADSVRIVTSVLTTSDVPLAGVFTTDADFERGTLVGLRYGGDQLQLSQEASVPPYLWVPNDAEGSVSKVDTRTGREVGRYRTCPPGITGLPSRTTVDLFGNCWVGNRQCGTVVKIGLLESGQFNDRNGNGVADTSRDLNGDGDITGAELLPWGQDECVLYEAVVIPGREGTFVPGTYTGGYANDYYTPGPRGMAVDAQGNVWAGTYGTEKYYYLEGSSARILRTVDVSSVNHTAYGAVIDANGILWSSGVSRNHLLRLNPADNSFSVLELGHVVYGLGLDRNNHLFVSSSDGSGSLSRVNVLTATKDWTVHLANAQGVTVTDDGDVWEGNYDRNVVTRWSNDGVLKATIPVGSVPCGMSVDAAGRVWVTDRGDEFIHRIDPATDAIDLSKRILNSGSHYGYSDMTGLISRNATTRFGTWTVRHNAKVEFTPWNALTWHGTNLLVTNLMGEASTVFTNLTVRVRSSNDQQQWSNWEKAENGYPLAATPAGQYLEIEVTLQQLSPEGNPALYDMAVTPLPRGVADLEVSQVWSAAYAWWPLTNSIKVLNHGPDEATGLVLTSSLPAGLTFLSASSSQGRLVQSNGLLRWDLGSLADGASLLAEVVVLATNPTHFLSSVGVRAYDTDAETSNNHASLAMTVSRSPCLDPLAGLVSWWPGEGNADDLTGANPGQLVNGATTSAAKVGYGFAFDGLDDFVEVPDSETLHSDRELTVGGWFRTEALNRNWQNVFWKGNVPDCSGNCENREYALFVNQEGWLHFTSTSADHVGSSQTIVNTPAFVVPGRWYNFAAVISSEQGWMRLYIDGELSAEGPYSQAGIRRTSGPLRIGQTPQAYPFVGQIDEVSLYNRALSAVEIQAVYRAGSGGLCKGPAVVPLTITPAPSGMLLRWPASASGWQLQFVDALFPGAVWQAESTQPWLTNLHYELLLPATNAQRFYRLLAP